MEDEHHPYIPHANTSLLVTSAKQITFSSALVCLFVSRMDYAKTAQPSHISVVRRHMDH